MNDLLAGEPEPRTLIDELLSEQQQFTAVERFAREHDTGGLPAQSRYYRKLLPLDKPRGGEQYAFGVDLDACTGCKACVSACHSLNGLDEEEVWRNVGFIHGGDSENAYQQTITTACHHCADPACLNGCPVKAYEKDAATGIVRHLDDQCIGCQYCVLKCPYDVPKYSKKRGIVRKCDMCYNRLAADEAPACVQACPTGAITIRIVDKAGHIASIKSGDCLLPDTFDSAYTFPTTAYTTRKVIPLNARASDAHALRLEHAHYPLILMLVLTQLSAGLFLVLALLGLFADASVFDAIKAPLALGAFAILNTGLGVSVLHLGKPLGAWRAFLGLRTSWMSREIFAFSIFAAAAGAFTLACVWEPLAVRVPLLRELEALVQPAAFAVPLGMLTALLGLAGVYCSAMIYIDTRRLFWEKELTLPKFFGTVLFLGALGAAALLAGSGVWASQPALVQTGSDLLRAALLLRVVLFGWEAMTFRSALLDGKDRHHTSARVMWVLQKPLLLAFCGLALASIFSGALALASGGWPLALAAAAALGLGTLAQILERYFYFTAVVAPRMPGGVAA